MTVVADIHSELVDRCAAGDRRAQSELFNLYAKPMFNVSMRIVNDQMVAEDILQECFIKVFDGLSGFRKESSFGSWMKRIVINRSINEVKKKRIRFVEMPDIPDDQDDEVKEPVYTVQDIHHAVYKLPEGYRIVFTLYMFEGLSHKQISEKLGISESTSKSQLSRARNQVKQTMIELSHGARQA